MSRRFPNWNYGYTLGPPMNNGGYSQYYNRFPDPSVMPVMPPRVPQYGFRPRRPFFRGRGGGPGMRGGHDGGAWRAPTPVPAPDTAPAGEEAVKKEDAAVEKSVGSTGDTPASLPKKDEEEKPLNDILKGRHPIVFCNEQSKIRGLAMDWEQVSETGPPHDKTFTWSLKMGTEMVTIGVANSKKAAKQKAAEDMARKLDGLGQPANSWGGNGGYSRKRPYPTAPYNTQYQMVQQNPKKQRKPEPSRSTEQSAMDKKSQNNPISKLYEHCRQKHWPEPLFETVSENVLETVKSVKGFIMKKIEFTMQCEVQGKKFVGTALTKKEAKYNAASAAWADVGVGVAQDSISNLLQTQRTTTTTSTAVAAAAAETVNN